MHRGYTREEYLDLIARLRAALPETTLSSDVIVGFPGESDEQFAETLSLAAEVRFAQLFAFAFSPRPRTPAARYGDRVSRNDAKSRLAELFALQAAVQIDLNRARIGRVVEVLVDGPAKRGERLWQGRGDDNRVVNFSHDGPVAPGDLVAVRVTGATAHSLLGRATDTSSGA
jgi:tRNA-2-methylthio-N6-dimethylallyladenosine synthase